MTVTKTFDFTAPVRLFYPVCTQNQLDLAIKRHLEQKAKGGKEQKVPTFNVQAVLGPKHSDLPELRELIAGMIEENYTDFSYEFPPGSGNHQVSTIDQAGKLLRSGTKTAEADAKKQAPKEGRYDFLKGQVLLKASSKFPISLAVTVNGKMVDLNDQNTAVLERKIFSGAEAMLTIKLFWYSATPIMPAGGVGAFLATVACTGEGSPYPNSKASPSAKFGGHAGKVTNSDPTKPVRRVSFDDEDLPDAEAF